LLPHFLEVQKNPVLEITHEECDELIHIVHELGREMNRTESGFLHKEIIQCYFSLLLARIGEIIHTRLKSKIEETNPSAKSRNEEYLSRFMEVLAKHYQEERSLGFYASKLCITPKDLTTIIKRTSGRSAAEWIDEYVTLEAKNLLRYSTMSIQEVAFYLHFPNQSFFGKYFKHQTGYTPSAYKMLK
jgi:AraC-like DNA-binding protein